MRKVIGLLLLSACTVRSGNGDVVTRSTDFDGFTGIISRHSFTALVHPGEDHRVEVTCDSNLIDAVVLGVEDDDLLINLDEQGILDPTAPCHLEVTVPSITRAAAMGSGNLLVDSMPGLSQIVSEGSGNVEVRGPITVPAFEAWLRGSGDVEIESLTADATDLRLVGSGNLEISGTSSALDLQLSGSGDADLRDLVATSATVLSAGSGDAEIHATDAVAGALSGSGNLVIWGNPPQRDVGSTGSGDLTFAE